MTEQYKNEITLKTDNYKNNIESNMVWLELYYNHKFLLYCQQKILIDEILDCLLVGLNQASIFATNHLLERMLKVALITNEKQGVYIGDIDYTSKYNEAKAKYDSQTLSNNIKYAFEQGIINEEEKNELFSLKDNFRNPYSHATMGIILKNFPQSISGFMGANISDGINALQEGKQIPLSEKNDIPTDIMGQYIQKDIAKDIAFEYFKRIFNIMCKIDDRLKI